MPRTQKTIFLEKSDFLLVFNRKYIFFKKKGEEDSVLRKGPDLLLRDFHALA